MDSKTKSLNFTKKVSPIAILLCAIFLGIEVSYPNDKSLITPFFIIDLGFIFYFTFEIIIRLAYNENTLKSFVSSFKSIFPKKQKLEKGEIEKVVLATEKDKQIVEHWMWLLFDFTIVLFGIASLFAGLLDHPESIAVLRLLRIFRVLRIFEISSTLKEIEKKIISVVPTVFVFVLLLFMIIYVYAIIGMHLYDFRKFSNIDFSSLYNAVTSLFIIITNGWAGALMDLKEGATNVPKGISDIYIFSFILFSVMVTLNVFIAVMTSQIQDKLEKKVADIETKEDEIQSSANENLKEMLNQFKELKNEMKELKNKIDNLKAN